MKGTKDIFLDHVKNLAIWSFFQRNGVFLVGAFIIKRARLLQSLVFVFKTDSKRRNFCSVCSTIRKHGKRIVAAQYKYKYDGVKPNNKTI